MKIQKINTGILIAKTAKQPSAKIEFSLDELDALSCGFIMKPVWYLEKELDTHGIPTGRTHKACSCLLCDSCGHKETVDSSFDEPYK